VDPPRVDLDLLINGWRGAFESAQAALGAASRNHDLPGAELQQRSRRLTDERTATVELLGGLAREFHTQRPGLVRLLASPREAKQLLGLPADVTGCVFNVDGVLVASAAIHAEAWKRVFDDFVFHWIDRTGATFATFSRRVDYPRLIHGRSRVGAVREFLASRGISLPEGATGDPPDAETVYGLANAKNRALRARIEQEGVSAFDGARLYLALAHDARLPCAVVSGSTNTRHLLEGAGLTTLIEECVDGNDVLSDGLRRKPAPDMLLAACSALGIEPAQTAVFETAEDGVVAGKSGGFELVVAVEQDGNRKALETCGADLVISDLGEMLERSLG
jgi:beta-phosphoglucomutase-like phosphatase (HAD superfamily)